MNRDLQAFVREALGRGLGREAIRGELVRAGWRASEIEAALGAFAESEFPVPVPRRRPYLSAQEAFLHLVLFATLFTAAFNVGAACFVMIEMWQPDPAHPLAEAAQRAGLRNAAAALIIAFPIYLAFARVIGRRLEREPEARGSLIRKWLTYVTLYVAALVIIGDLTVLVSRLLSGELSVRFLLKVAVVFGIAATVFVHHLWSLRADESEVREPRPAPRWLGRAAAVAVFAVVAGALVLAGSPARERLRVLDRQRVDHLREISRVMDDFARVESRLPGTLDELARWSRAGVLRTRDPVTGAVYEYVRTDSLSYVLCATFDAVGMQESDAPRHPGEPSRFWDHGAGRHCFTLEARTDPERLPR